MPTYEYECKKCRNTFDVFHSMSDPPVKTCPTCGGSVRRLINGGTGIIFKGSGFYVNDSKGSRAATSGSGSTSESKTKNETDASKGSDAAKSGSDASKGSDVVKSADGDAAKSARGDAAKSAHGDTKGKEAAKSEKVSEKAPT